MTDDREARMYVNIVLGLMLVDITLIIYVLGKLQRDVHEIRELLHRLPDKPDDVEPGTF